MNGRSEKRVDKIVADLLRGRRLKLRAGDAEEKEAITTAARLAGTRHGPQRMRSEFRKRLERRLEAQPADGWVTRRAALVAGLGLAAGAAGGAFMSRAVEPRALSRGGGEAVEPRNGVWVDVASLDELAEGEGKRVTAGGVGAFVFRRGDGVTAVSSVCSHLPCDLSWQMSDSTLNCPCHPVKFTSAGKSLEAYPLPDLNPVHARVTAAGRVEVLGTE